MLHSNVREKSKQDRLPNRSQFDKNKGHPEQVEILSMKQEPGRDMVIYGSISIVRTLTTLGLIGRYPV